MSYIIYKICCDDLPEYIYVGSTANFRCRKSQHKQNCNNGCTQKLYTTIRENGGWDNWRMVIIEECKEVTLIQARIKEEECRIKLKANLNMVRCHLSEEELNEQKKQYYEANIEKIREYREANKEQKKEYNKEYYEANNEEIKEQKKEYYEANKEKINEYKNQKFTCECGRTVNLGVKARHLKSNVHKELMEEINNKII